jgi:hypothetical protein
MDHVAFYDYCNASANRLIEVYAGCNDDLECMMHISCQNAARPVSVESRPITLNLVFQICGRKRQA